MLYMFKRIKMAVCVGMLTLLSVTGVGAAGLGVVDFQALEQQHRQFPQAVAAYQNYIKQYRSDYTTKSKNLTDQQKQQLVQAYNTQLNQNRVALFGPIDQDIIKQIRTVESQKGLSNVAVKGYVIDGTFVDITKDVAQRIK